MVGGGGAALIDTSKPVNMLIGGGQGGAQGQNQDGGAQRNIMETSTQASGQTALDWKAFEAECKKIVHDISDRFIDLGLDDHESDFGANELQAKQERFEREFQRMPFNFEAHSLQLPAAAPGNEDAILEEDDE